MLLELKNISLRYSGAGGEAFNLLDGVGLSVEEGTVTALIGGNGAGKTTLFNIVSGFEKDFRGQVLLDGADITALPAHRIARRGVGRLFQGRQLLGDLTLMENLIMASDETALEKPFASLFLRSSIRRSEAGKKEKAAALLDRVFGPGNKYLGQLDRKASELSFGEQRLLALVRLLMGEGRLLLLDEPTSGVNPKYIETIGKIIRDMVDREGKTVLMIEHNMSFVRSVADRCHYLADGRIIRSGAVSEILDDPVIHKDYLGL